MSKEEKHIEEVIDIQDKSEEKLLNNSQPTMFMTTFAVVVYVVLFSSQSILIQASSKSNGKFGYSTFSVVIIVEFFKAIFSISLHFYSIWKEGSENIFELFIKSIKASSKTAIRLFIPALIYSMYNNILFFNVSYFGPGVYKVLMNSRIVIIALLSVSILKKNINFQKWVSLLLLTFGCSFVELSQFTNGKGLKWFHFIILFQSFLSSIGSVSNEYILKTQKEVALNLQNFWLYVYGVILNSIFLFLSIYVFKFESTTTGTSLFESFSIILSNPLSMLIVFNWCLAGVVTSYILKYLSSVTKSYATATEMIVVAIVSALLFGKNISISFFIAALIVIAAIFIYNTEYEMSKFSLQIILYFTLICFIVIGAYIFSTKETIDDPKTNSDQWKKIWEKKDGFDIITKKQYNTMIRKLVEKIEVKPKAKVLEFGVGSGAFLKALKKNFPEGTFFVGDMRNVDFFLDETFDNVFAFSVSHYLNSELDIKKFLTELYRVCKKGGTIFIGDVNDHDKKELAKIMRSKSHKG
eukprot:gene4629-8202_t